MARSDPRKRQRAAHLVQADKERREGPPVSPPRPPGGTSERAYHTAYDQPGPTGSNLPPRAQALLDGPAGGVPMAPVPGAVPVAQPISGAQGPIPVAQPLPLQARGPGTGLPTATPVGQAPGQLPVAAPVAQPLTGTAPAASSAPAATPETSMDWSEEDDDDEGWETEASEEEPEDFDVM